MSVNYGFERKRRLLQRRPFFMFYGAEDNKPSFVFTRIIYLEHGLLRVSSFLQDATGGAEKRAFLSFFGIAPNRVYTDGRRCRLPGELLPHLFTVTGLPTLFSVALSRRLPSADVIRYSFPLELGLSSEKAVKLFPRSRVLRARKISLRQICVRGCRISLRFLSVCPI